MHTNGLFKNFMNREALVLVVCGKGEARPNRVSYLNLGIASDLGLALAILVSMCNNLCSCCSFTAQCFGYNTVSTKTANCLLQLVPLSKVQQLVDSITKFF